MPTIARLIEKIRRSDVPTTSVTKGSLSGWSISPRQDKKKLDNLQAVAIAFDGALPKVLFLIAGTEENNSTNLDIVRRKIKENIQRVSQEPTSSTPEEESPTLSLKYDDNPDIEALWTHQTPRQRMLLVMCVQPGEKNAAQYAILKKACDVEVGIPSISVNRGTLLAKSEDPGVAAAMVVGSICLKLRLRNPLTLMNSPKVRESRHLVISIHVKPFTPPGPVVLKDGSRGSSKKEMVLVALVSRALESSVDYHTEVKLYSKLAFEKLGVTALLDPFLESIKSSPRDLTILRTGYLVDGSATSDSSFTSKARRLLMERNDIAKAYANIPKHGAFKYATLSEDKFLKVTASDQDCTPHGNNRTPLLITKLDAREVAGQSSFWVFHDKKTADSTTGIKVTFLPEVDPSISSQTTNGTDSVGKQHEHDTGLSQTAHDVPTEPRVSHVLSGLIKPPPSPLQEPRSPPAPSNHPAAEVASPEEVDILGRIWIDDHLELYDIKWPTPTNLAQLALKRAQMHLVSNDWDNRLQGQTAPVFLPEVHENVRNTLYYT